MKKIIGRMAGALLALVLTSGLAGAQSRITIAVGGGACLCYLPTVLAQQLGEYDKAGLAVELVDLKGGSDALRAVLGGSADVVSGYFDHCVNLAAKKQELQSFVVYDRYPGLVLVVSPKHTSEIRSIADLGESSQVGAGSEVAITPNNTFMSNRGLNVDQAMFAHGQACFQHGPSHHDGSSAKGHPPADHRRGMDQGREGKPRPREYFSQGAPGVGISNGEHDLGVVRGNGGQKIRFPHAFQPLQGE